MVYQDAPKRRPCLPPPTYRDDLHAHNFGLGWEICWDPFCPIGAPGYHEHHAPAPLLVNNTPLHPTCTHLLPAAPAFGSLLPYEHKLLDLTNGSEDCDSEVVRLPGNCSSENK